MRFVRWLSDWREFNSSGAMHLGSYCVVVAAAVTTTLAVIDTCLTRVTAEANQIIASLERGDTSQRRTLKDDTNDPARGQVAAVDLRGYRTAVPVDQSSMSAKPPAGIPHDSPVRISRPLPHASAGMVTDPRREWYRGYGDTYTTVCVRLCDGAIRPVSFSATEDRFDHDRRTCQSGCSAPSRLYVYRNPGETVDDMTDLSGQPYARLKTAYLFKTTYVASCTCRAQPWEQAAADRHRVYALQDKAQRGDAKARAELKGLGTKVAALTGPTPETAAEIDGGTAASFRSRRPATIQSTGGEFYRGSGRSPSQVVTSGSIGWPAPTVMRLSGSTSSSSYNSRSGSSGSRDTGWKARMFEPR